MGTTSEKLTYLNTTKTLIKDNLNLGGANISTEPFRAYSSKLKGIYKDYLTNGTDVLWNNWEKVSGTGETLSLSPTIKGKMKVELKGNTQQNGTPTPDTPIPVQVVSGDNTIKVEGKNLLNPSDVIASNKTTISGEEITINDDSTWAAGYVICGDKITSGTYKISSIGNTGQLRLLVRGYKNGDIYASGLPQSAAYSSYYGASVFDYFTNDISLTLDNTCDYYYVGIALYRQGSETFKLQVEKGTTATTYTPYVSQTYPINLGNIELCKIGTYQDSIVKDNGKWYLEKKIGKVVLNGSETGWTYLDSRGNYYRYFRSHLNDGSTGTKPILSNYFKDRYSQAIGEYNFIQNPGSDLYIQIENVTTLANFKTWLSTHNTIVYYVLATPTYEEITSTNYPTLYSQLQIIDNANSYEGTTNISQENDDMPFILDVTALKEMS